MAIYCYDNSVKRKFILGLGNIKSDFKLLSESINYDSRLKLYEEYGFYDGLEDNIEIISNYVLDMLKTGKHEYCFDVNFRGISNINKCSITLQNIFYNADASVEIKNDILYLDIRIPQSLYFNDEEYTIREWLNNELSVNLCHELSHVKNDINTNDNDFTLKWYEIAYLGINRLDSNSLTFLFCYYLYRSYYGEVQAISNETILKIEKDISKIYNFERLSNSEKKKEIINAFHNNTNYEDCLVCYYFFLPRIKEITSIDKESIFGFFNKNGLEMTDKVFNSFVRQIEFSNNRILSKIRRGLNKIYKKCNLIQ